MLRSTVGNASPNSGQLLETLLQNRLGLKYMESRQLVANGRQKLGMDKHTPWTVELETECLRIYEQNHGPIQAKDYSTPERTMSSDSSTTPTSVISKTPSKMTPTPSEPMKKTFTRPTPPPAAPVVSVKKEAREPEMPVDEPVPDEKDPVADEKEAPAVPPLVEDETPELEEEEEDEVEEKGSAAAEVAPEKTSEEPMEVPEATPEEEKKEDVVDAAVDSSDPAAPADSVDEDANHSHDDDDDDDDDSEKSS